MSNDKMKPYEINIRQVHTGWIVKGQKEIGPGEFSGVEEVFELSNRDKLLSLLGSMIHNPGV